MYTAGSHRHVCNDIDRLRSCQYGMPRSDGRFLLIYGKKTASPDWYEVRGPGTGGTCYALILTLIRCAPEQFVCLGFVTVWVIKFPYTFEPVSQVQDNSDQMLTREQLCLDFSNRFVVNLPFCYGTEVTHYQGKSP